VRKGFTSLSGSYAIALTEEICEALDEEAYLARIVQEEMLRPTPRFTMGVDYGVKGSRTSMVIIDEMGRMCEWIDGEKYPMRMNNGNYVLATPHVGSASTITFKENLYASSHCQQQRRKAHPNRRERDCGAPREPQGWRYVRAPAPPRKP
jgi:hypothetical protein